MSATSSLVVASGLVQGRPEKELAYVIAKRLTFMRPDHFVRWSTVVPTVGELKMVFLAALKLIQPKFEVKADVAQGVGQYLGYLQKSVAAQQREALAAVVQRFVTNKGEADIHKWANAVDMTGWAIDDAVTIGQVAVRARIPEDFFPSCSMNPVIQPGEFRLVGMTGAQAVLNNTGDDVYLVSSRVLAPTVVHAVTYPQPPGERRCSAARDRERRRCLVPARCRPM